MPVFIIDKIRILGYGSQPYFQGEVAMAKHRAGGKFASSHTTVIDAAAVVVDIAKKQPEVTKVVLGIIEGVKSKKNRLKFKPIQAGLEVKVYGNSGLQTLYIYTSDPGKVRGAIESASQMSAKSRANN